MDLFVSFCFKIFNPAQDLSVDWWIRQWMCFFCFPKCLQLAFRVGPWSLIRSVKRFIKTADPICACESLNRGVRPRVLSASPKRLIQINPWAAMQANKFQSPSSCFAGARSESICCALGDVERLALVSRRQKPASTQRFRQCFRSLLRPDALARF